MSTRPKVTAHSIAGRRFLDTFRATGDAGEAFAAALKSYNAAAARRPVSRQPLPASAATRAIRDAVARRHQVTPQALRGAGGDEFVAAVRQEAIYLCRVGGCLIDDIGRAFGRTRGEVLVSIRRFRKRLATDELLARRVAEIKQQTDAARRAA
jgi:chromosomal replication initiation ATPase DnaA